MSADPTAAPPSHGWLNQTVLGAGLTSFLADVCYEMATSILPSFITALRLPAAALIGVIEGTADAVANFAKLGVGWYGDRIGRRKPFVVFGYALTGVTQALFALATGFPLIFIAKTLGWLGKGIRGPLRNAILADAVDPADRGKAFGLHRAGDTLGAVLGPLLAYAILEMLPAPEADPTATFRFIFWLTLVPGIGSALSFALLIRERNPGAKLERKLGGALSALPQRFRRFLVAVGVFGCGDCTDKLLIFAAVSLTDSKSLTLIPLLYAWRNLVQAAVSFPIGWMSDRIGSRRPLIGGYALGALTMASFAIAFLLGNANLLVVILLVTLAGAYLATEEALESVVTADLVPDRTIRGTAYGALGVVNGLGDLVASLIVGMLMQYVSGVAAFGVAAGLMAAGTASLAWATASRKEEA